MIFTIFLSKAVTGIPYKKSDNIESDAKLDTAIQKLNDAVKFNNILLRNLVDSKLLGNNNNDFDLKCEILPSLIYENLSYTNKKIHVAVEDLVVLLKALKDCKSQVFIETNHLNIIKIIDPTTKQLKEGIKIDNAIKNKRKVSLNINYKFLYNYETFAKVYTKEVNFTQNNIHKENNILKLNYCKSCGLIMPSCFILRIELRETYLMTRFENKLKFDFLNGVSKIFMHPNFLKDGIENCDKLISVLSDLLNYASESDLETKIKILMSGIEDEINKLDISKEERLIVFVDMITQVILI